MGAGVGTSASIRGGLMTSSQFCTTARTEDRGSALVAVLLLLMLMSALAFALTVSARTETLVARNHQSAAQARAAAEAGLNHAVAAAAAFLFDYKVNGYATVSAALDALLADPTLLMPDIALGSRTELSDTGAEYEASIMDEDDPARGSDTTNLTGDGDASNDEDGNAETDSNLKLIVRAVGYTRDNASAVIEGIIGPLPLPAVVVNGDLEIDGNATITGGGGSAHSNGDMEIDGNVTISGDATASGTLDVDDDVNIGGDAEGGRPEIHVPTIRATDYRSGADFVLTEDGRVTLVNGSVLCDASDDKDACKTAYGWKFEGDGDGWKLEDSDVPGTFYVEGDVDINGNIGSDADPLEITIISEGSIDVNGNARVTPETAELMFIADGDMRLQGNFKMAATPEAQILVREQIRIEGNAEIAGHILVENVQHEDGEDWHRDHDNLSDDHRIRSNAKITYSGNLASGTFVITGWREVR